MQIGVVRRRIDGHMAALTVAHLQRRGYIVGLCADSSRGLNDPVDVAVRNKNGVLVRGVLTRRPQGFTRSKKAGTRDDMREGQKQCPSFPRRQNKHCSRGQGLTVQLQGAEAAALPPGCASAAESSDGGDTSTRALRTESTPGHSVAVSGSSMSSWPWTHEDQSPVDDVL